MKVEKKYILRHRSSHNFYHPCTISQKATEGYAPSTKRVNKEKQKELFSENRGDFPGSPVVKNPPANSGNMGLIPGLGTKIQHAMRQLSLYHPRACAALGPVLGNKRSCCNEKPTCHDKRVAPTHDN